MQSTVTRGWLAVALGLVAAFALAACGGGGGGGGGSQGELSTALTDSSTDDYQAVYVTIARVEVHHDDSGTWQTVAEPGKTYNLLNLVNGVRAELGIATLDTGHYTQMRLIIDETGADDSLNLFSRRHPHPNYFIDRAGNAVPLKVPSGANTGWKIVNGFDINENQTTELLLDFDVVRSIVKAGSSGKYLLKPTVKVLRTEDYAIVSGLVTNVPPVTTPPTAATPLAGAIVTAQVAGDPGVDAGTVADATGAYALFLEPRSYNVVAARAGYFPDCTAATLAAGSRTTIDFSLAAAPAPPGTVTGSVRIDAVPGDQWATIDIRQDLDCGAGATPITVKSFNLGDGGSYAVELPAGSYTLVATTFGRTTQSSAFTITSGAATTRDLVFPAP